jgi:hypothetical protein
MNAPTLMAALTGRGVRLAADGDRLILDAPRGAVTEGERAALGRHKAEVLALLKGPRQEDPVAPPPWPPRDPELTTWPVEWRERWGRRAAVLEGAGVPWPLSEQRAFVEIRSERAAVESGVDHHP